MMNNSVFSSNKMNWQTPPELFESLDKEFHFNLDAAASPENAKCENYYTIDNDALNLSWGGYTVFCNPPYGREINKWVEKGYTEAQKDNTIVVMLIPVRTDTSYWHDYILNDKADEIRFLRGRIKFLDENGEKQNNAPFPSAIVIYGTKIKENVNE